MAAYPDRLVESLVLKAMEPASLELSLRAGGRAERDREQLHTHWKQRLERTGYEADRAKRQYDSVNPENRLVARELERQWKQKLGEKQNLEEDHAVSVPSTRVISARRTESGSARWRRTCRGCGAA